MYLKGKKYDMNLINFIEQFPDETSCKLKFKEMRDSVGVTCRHCGSKEHYWQQSIWMYECKHCKTMGLRDGKYQLDKIVELDEGFFESVDTERSEDEKSDKLKRGRGSQKQSKVIVMASTVHPLKAPEKHKKRTKFRYVKMIVVDDLKSDTIEQQVVTNIVRVSLVKTDNYISYSKLKNMVWSHQAETVKPKDEDRLISHITFCN